MVFDMSFYFFSLDSVLKIGNFIDKPQQIILPSCCMFSVSFGWRGGAVLGALGLEDREFSVGS